MILEQSRFATETGAAIHLAPNANGILRRLGIFAEDAGANLMQCFTEYTAAGEKTRSMNTEESSKIWQHPWLLAHRVHLHETLRKVATSPDRKGQPVQLHTSSKVVDVDPATASLRGPRPWPSTSGSDGAASSVVSLIHTSCLNRLATSKMIDRCTMKG